ncbi:MAG: hypothetical protein EOP04_17965 [Proteobacteria bacterium]|nr:MAG: hypothetical protein EOP04_17965 [Pseudomonadota bacterium]
MIDYIKLAATFLMRAHGDRVCKIYIEVNASRKRLLGGLGFKEASVQPASGGAQYQDGTDFLLEVDPYDFALAAFAR